VANPRKPTNPTFDDLDPSVVEVQLERTPCLGWCPEYSVTITGEGHVLYSGRSFVVVANEQEAEVSRDSVRELVAQFEKAEFFDLDLNCGSTVMDAPSVRLQLRLGDRSRAIINHWTGPSFEDDRLAAHRVLDAIADSIDRAVGIEQWIGTEDQRKTLFEHSRDGRPPPTEGNPTSARSSAHTATTLPPQGEEQEMVSRLLEEAKRLARGGPASEREALAAFSKAEDEAAKGLDRSMQRNDETASAFFVDKYRQILTDSDAFVTSVFTTERVEATQWVDLLAADQDKHWQRYGVKQFRMEGGILQVLGPDSGDSEYGLIAFPDPAGLRDFDLELEFTLKGTIDWLFRLGRRVDNTVEAWFVSTGGMDPLKEGRSYTLHATMIGSRLTGRLVPEDAVMPMIESSWTKSRKGAVGAQIDAGADLKITRFRIRRLRDA
jgi:hypothetical protein